MSKQRSQRSPEDANYWINEAEERLDHARGYVSGKNARILCEQAHYAAEFAIKALIIANGCSFATNHDIKGLLETAQEAGEEIPAEVEKAKALSTYAGRGRYEFDRDPRLTWIGKEEYDYAVNSATTTVEWSRERIATILHTRSKRLRSETPPNPETSGSSARGASEEQHRKTRERNPQQR